MTKKIISGVLIIFFLFSCSFAEQFGSYWQINGEEKTPIEWLVLKETDDAILLLAKYSLDANIFNNTVFTTWGNSQMRYFLNSYFYDNAFSKEEKERIILSKIITPKNSTYPSTSQGSITYDYVFLLSIQEVEQYLTGKNRIAAATNFARIGHARIIGDKWAGAYVSPYGATAWRLRTMGIDNYHVTNVRENGEISYCGDILYAPHYAIRPAIWIKK